MLEVMDRGAAARAANVVEPLALSLLVRLEDAKRRAVKAMLVQPRSNRRRISYQEFVRAVRVALPRHVADWVDFATSYHDYDFTKAEVIVTVTVPGHWPVEARLAAFEPDQFARAAWWQWCEDVPQSSQAYYRVHVEPHDLELSRVYYTEGFAAALVLGDMEGEEMGRGA